MKRLGDLVATALTPTASERERQTAFREIVCRFQDMAFACAYALLGDYQLAEDAAQEAFLTAWQRLSDLKERDAFPGWFRSIVRTHCNRIRRVRQVQIVPLEAAASLPGSRDPLFTLLERQQLQNAVQDALGRLSEGERLATALFYINAYSHKEIAAFLGITIPAVKQRLYMARKRLKGELITMVKDNIQEQRPSGGTEFVDRVQACLRAFDAQDWPEVAALAREDEAGAEGIEDWLARRQQFDEQRSLRRHFIAEDASSHRPLGYGAIEQQDPDPHRFRLYLVAPQQRLREETGTLLYTHLMGELQALKAKTVWAREYTASATLLDFLREQGFAEAARVLDLRLKVAEADLATLQSAAPRLSAQGITFSTLAEARERTANSVERLQAFWNAVHAAKKSPAYPSLSREDVARRLEMPHILPEAYFLAQKEERILGMANLRIGLDSPPERPSLGIAVLDASAYQDMAMALGSQAIAYSRDHNYTELCAFARTEDTTPRVWYAALGYRQHLEMVLLEKTL